MMLRASIPADESATTAGLLVELVDAVVGDDGERADRARAAVVDRLGADWLVDSCAVIANFEMMTRLADGTGARLRPQQIVDSAELRRSLGVDAFPSARS